MATPIYTATITQKTVFGKTLWIVTVTIGTRSFRRPFATKEEAETFVASLGQIIDDIVIEIIPA